jgi:hypothetical protein
MACLLAETSLTVADSRWAQLIGSGFGLAATMRGDGAAERTTTSA